MSDGVFVIRNQLGQYWARGGEWVDGREPQRLLKLKHEDEAINQLVELSAKDVTLRGEVRATELNAKKEPQIEASEHLTPTLAEQAAARQAAAHTATQAAAEETAQEAAEAQTGDGNELPSAAAL